MNQLSQLTSHIGQLNQNIQQQTGLDLGQPPLEEIKKEDVSQLVKNIGEYLFKDVHGVEFGWLPFDEESLEVLLKMKQKVQI